MSNIEQLERLDHHRECLGVWVYAARSWRGVLQGSTFRDLRLQPILKSHLVENRVPHSPAEGEGNSGRNDITSETTDHMHGTPSGGQLHTTSA